MFNNNQQAQAGGLLSNQNAGQQNQGGGLFGQNNQQNQPQGGGLFGAQNNQPQQQQGGLFNQNTNAPAPQGGLFANNNQSNPQASNNQNTNLFNKSQQNPTPAIGGGAIFGNNPQNNAQQPQQSAGGQPSGGLFGNMNNQQTTPNPTPQTQSSMFANIANQQQPQQSGTNQAQQANQTPNIFGGATAAASSNTQQTGGLFGNKQQGGPQSSGNLFGGATSNNTPSTTNNPQGSQPQSNTAPSAVGGGLFGMNQNQPATSTTQNQPNQGTNTQPTAANTANPQPATGGAPAQTGGGLFGNKASAPTGGPSNIGGGSGLFGANATQGNATSTNAPAPSNSGGLFGNQNNQAQPQASAPKLGGLFGNSNNTGTTATANQPAAQTEANQTANQPAGQGPNLFSTSVVEPKVQKAANQPAQPPPQVQGGNVGGLFAQKTENKAPVGGAPSTDIPPMNLNANPTSTQQPKTSNANLISGKMNLGGATQTASATSNEVKPTPVGGASNITAPQATAGTSITGNAPAGVNNASLNPSNQLPVPRKNHQFISQASGPDERLDMDIDSAKRLNGSLHMFCQNIHKYKPDHVKKFFENSEIFAKLKQGLLMYRTEQNSEQWENVKKEAKEGKTPLKFWSERLSKYKYQYLIVMIIDELSDYLQIKPLDCYYFFDKFLSHETKFVDFFFDPSSNEPCIEYFYEQQALTFEANNVGIRKDSPFIINLKTSFMKDIYFHERNSILASLRLLLLMTEEQDNYAVVKNLIDGLVKDKLEQSLWDQYIKPQSNGQLSAEDNELFQLQQQFENDQIIKLLFIISQKGYSKVSVVTYLTQFTEQNFMGNWNKLQPQNENTFENKNKINELSTVVGDSCLMLILSKNKELTEIKDKNNNQEQRNTVETILKAKNSNQQIQVLHLNYFTLSKNFKITTYDQIEYLYKLITRILSYKNLGILKVSWQEIFFDLIFRIISGVYDIQDTYQMDEYQESVVSECISRALAKSIYKNPKLIDLFWERLENKQKTEQFSSCFKNPIAVYKVMKSAMGVNADPKSRHVIVYLTTLDHFNWYKFNQIVETQALDETHILRLRLMYKLIAVDPKCIDLLQFVFNYKVLNQQNFEQYFNDCKGEEVVKFVIKSFSLYNEYRNQAYQNFFAGLKALNVLLNNHQYLTQQILQIEEYQDLFAKEYRRIAMQNDINATEYRMKCKREILNILYTILKDFEEPLLAFSQIKGMERNSEYDSPLLLHLFIFFANIIEDWEQNQGVIYLKHKWKIGSLIMKITDICLNRLSVNVYKKNDFRPVQSDSYTSFFLNSFLCNQLKKIRVDEMIIKVLEVAANSSSISNNKLNNKALKLNNKYWQTYVMNSSFKFKEFQVEHIKNQVNLKSLIVDTMKVLETIMQLVEQKIQIRKQDFEYRFLQKSMLFDEIPILDFFERIICKSDCIFHYKQEYYTDSSLNSIKINILYAISSYINFENHFYSAQDEVNPTLPFYLYNLLENEGNLINQLGDAHYLIDYDAIRNPLNTTRLPNGTFSNSISALSLRILTQIMLVWEAQQSIRKPILVDFLSNMNMENYWEKLNYSAINTHLTSFIIEMFNILKLNEYDSNFDSEVLRKGLSDNSCAVIDFMLTALYTQPLFMNLILKPDNLNRTKKKDNDLKIRFKRFFESSTSQYDMRLLNKYLNLLVEIFKRDQMYPSFCQEFRQDTQYIFEKITKVVVQNFKPYEIDQLVDRDLQSLQSPKEPNIPLFEFQKLKLTQLLREHVKHQELNQQMYCLHSFQILLDLISKEYLSNKFKSVQSIQNSLKSIFENKQLNHIMNSLAKFSPSYSLEIWPTPQAIQTKMNIENEESVKGKIFQQSFFYLLETNQYSYGRGYAQDSSEIVFNKIDVERSSDYLQRAKYILYKIIEFRQKSIKWSIEEIKTRTFDSWIRLFCLITSAGTDGYAMSTTQSALPNFTLKQLRERKIILEHDQLCLLYPNYEIEFVSGFVNILSTSNSQCVGLFSNLQSEIMKQILQDLKKGYFGPLFDQKLKFLLYLLGALRHLQDLDLHSQDSENKKQVNPNHQIGRANQKQESQHSFSDSYKKEEAEDLFKVMTQILEEAVNRGSRVQICDFIQCLFLQLQVMEVLYNQYSQNNNNKIYMINENLNPYFIKVIGILMNLFAQNIDGLPILVSCLNSVLHIYPQFFILQFRYQIKALEYLINKIFYEKNETAQIFVSVINLLRDLAKYPEGAQLLSEANIVTLICNTPIFKNIENEPFYWQNGERNLLHSFWCWTLSFYKEYVMSVPSDLDNTFSSLQFLQTYFTRIAKILSIPQVLQNTSTAIPTSKMMNTEQEKLSLAYMEEIEQILELLAIYFCQANIFKKNMSNDFEQILQFLTHCTIFLFKQGLLIQSIFMPVSKMEKKLSQIYDLYPSSQIDNHHLFTSMQTPSQTPNKQELESNISAHTSISDANILFSLFSCIQDGLQESSLLQLFQYSSNSFNDVGTLHENKQVYSVGYWQNFATSLLDCLKFVENALNKWDFKKNKNINMEDQLVKLRALTNSVEYNLCSYGFGSQTFLIQNAKSIIQTTQQSLHQIILSAIKHFQMLNEFKQWFGHSINNLSEQQNKLNSKLDGMKKLEYEDALLKKQIEEAINIFQKLSIMYERY